jgi:hypothetical protein
LAAKNRTSFQIQWRSFLEERATFLLSPILGLNENANATEKFPQWRKALSFCRQWRGSVLSLPFPPLFRLQIENLTSTEYLPQYGYYDGLHLKNTSTLFYSTYLVFYSCMHWQSYVPT